MSSTLVQSTSLSSSYKNTLGASYRQISHTFLPFSGFVLGRSWKEWPLPVRSIANFLKFSNSLKRKYIHRRGPFIQNLFINPIAVFEWFECGCRNLCGKISTCLGYFRVIILCLGFASPLHDITESSLRLYVKFGEVFERKISSAKKCGACNLFPLGLAVAVCLSFSFYTRGCLLLLFGACVVVFQTHCISNFNFSSARLILQNKKLALYCF